MDPTPADLATADRVTKFWSDVLTEALPVFYKKLVAADLRRKHALQLTETWMVQLMDSSDGPSDADEEDFT